MEEKVSPNPPLNKQKQQPNDSSSDESSATDLDARRNSLLSPQLSNLLVKKSQKQKKWKNDQRFFLEKLESRHQLTSKASMSSVISDR
jgi:hypothetical protein